MVEYRCIFKDVPSLIKVDCIVLYCKDQINTVILNSRL